MKLLNEDEGTSKELEHKDDSKQEKSKEDLGHV